MYKGSILLAEEYSFLEEESPFSTANHLASYDRFLFKITEEELDIKFGQSAEYSYLSYDFFRVESCVAARSQGLKDGYKWLVKSGKFSN
jgi:hypothetical protein